MTTMNSTSTGMNASRAMRPVPDIVKNLTQSIRPLVVVSAALMDGMRRVYLHLRRAQERSAMIAQLSALDDGLLKDIGISRDDIPAAIDRLTDSRSTANDYSPTVAA